MEQVQKVTLHIQLCVLLEEMPQAGHRLTYIPAVLCDSVLLVQREDFTKSQFVLQIGFQS